MTTEEKCENCKYFYYDATRKIGMCRRYPPSVAVYITGRDEEVYSKSYGEYPDTDKSKWCGEFKEKKV